MIRLYAFWEECMKIGIFDSGIGGLSVLHQAMLTLPEAFGYDLELGDVLDI